MANDEIILKGRLNGNQRNRLVKLLDMYYKPSEIAEVIGFEVRQVYRVYVPLGCPYVRDSIRRLWINGKEFRNWYLELYAKRELKLNEAFCLTCRKAVRMVDPVRNQEGRLFYYSCICPTCGRKLARIITRGKPIHDR